MKKPSSKKTGQSSAIRAGYSPRPVKTLNTLAEDSPSPSGGSETPSPPPTMQPSGATALREKTSVQAPINKGGVVRFKKK